MRRTIPLIASAASLALVSCYAESRSTLDATNTPDAQVNSALTQEFSLSTGAAIDRPGLSNLVVFQAIDHGEHGLISGGAPSGALGMQTLAQLGIATIISVDGALPDVATAKKLGMRTVHVPIRYDGVTDEQRLTLVRAVRDLPKPIYLHCHHGKHRSAAAAGVIAVSLGWMTRDEACERMKVSGTAAAYPGLWRCVRESAVMDAAALDRANVRFTEVSEPSTLVALMVELDEAIERLNLLERNEWRAPATHPDLAAAAECARLADLLDPVRRGVDLSTSHGLMAQEFAPLRNAATAMESALVAAEPQADTRGHLATATKASLTRHFQAISAGCRDCHVKHRDAPTH